MAAQRGAEEETNESSRRKRSRLWLGGPWERAHLGIAAVASGVCLLLSGMVSRTSAIRVDRVSGFDFAMTSLLSLCLWSALAGWTALAGRLLLRFDRGRLAALFGALFLGIFHLMAISSIILRHLSGSFLTAAATDFSLSSPRHFLHAATGSYAPWFIVAATVFFVATLVAYRVLRRAAGTAGPFGIGGVPTTVAITAALLVMMTPDPDRPELVDAWSRAPLGALFASTLGPSLERSESNPLPAARMVPLPGPSLDRQRAWQQAAAGHQGPRPNVLLVMLESVNPSHLGFAGYHRPTPGMDRLARHGWTLRRAWTTATHSNYAQMAVLSSLFPRRGTTLDMYQRLDYPRVLFHDLFHRLGYDTATISSQDEDWQGMRRFQQTSTPTYYWYSANHEGERLDTGTEKIVPDEQTITVALDWLSTSRRKPWALYVNLQGTHFPYATSERARRPYQPDTPDPASFTYLRYPEADREKAINRYDNALAHVDDQIRRLIAFLEKTKQLSDTLWVVTSDHGELFFHKGLVTHGRTLDEAESRVPLVVHWPEKLEPTIIDEPVSHLDILPTLVDLLGLPPHPAFQGQSFVSQRPHGRAPAVFMNIQGLRFADAIVCWPFKFVATKERPRGRLFRLDIDPNETRDRSFERPRVRDWLAGTLSAQLRAQERYHSESRLAERQQRFQPRLLTCPSDWTALSTP